MDSPGGWRKDVSFAERLNLILRIKTAYKSAYPDLSAEEAHKDGRSEETNILQQASSKVDYYRLCNEKIASLESLAATRTPSDSSSSEGSPTPGLQIGPYAHATFHDDGMFSTVFKAYSNSDPPELLALKVTSHSQFKAPHNPLREARILQRAVHPSVVRLISASPIEGGRFLLVFPFLPLDLEAWIGLTISSSECLSPFAPNLLHDLFSALAHIHSLGIIHRDIKPSNILLASSSGPAYLADFGIAWMSGDEDSEPADQKITDVGTTCYRPPELLFGNTSYGCSLDMWAAGCVTAEVFLGHSGSLFNSGELGGDLALIFSIFSTLGTPSLESWPEAAKFPSWGKIEFAHFPSKTWDEILPLASDEVRDFVEHLVVYESSQRLPASAALNHPFFAGVKT